MTDPWGPKREEFARYAIQCADGTIGKHFVTRVSVRPSAFEDAEKANAKGCGPHTLLQQNVVMVTTAYGPLTGVDPATASLADWVQQVEQHACPKCGVEVGERCLNLSKRARGVTAYTSMPHAERAALVDAPTIREA